MPNTKSAKKRLRQNFDRRAVNRRIKTSLRTQIRKVLEAVESEEVEKAEQEFRVASQKLDRAGARNIIHRNKAARQKSRLQRIIKAAKA